MDDNSTGNDGLTRRSYIRYGGTASGQRRPTGGESLDVTVH